MKDSQAHRRRLVVDNDETDRKRESHSKRPRVDPDERDEYDEWRRERGGRGRKKKGKAGGRHERRSRSDD
jgi:hypothetical protein